MLENYLYIIHGDITQLRADAITYSTSKMIRGDGQLYASFRDRLPGFAQKFEALSNSTGVRNAGDSHWVPLDGDYPKGVIVTISTGRGINRRSLVWKTVESSIELAVHTLAVPTNGERLLVALPCFLMGAGGGISQRVILAKIQVAAAAACLKKYKDIPIDVVFVTYTKDLYHLFLEARRSLPSKPEPINPKLVELENALKRRECTLFIGAGASSGAGVASWEALNQRMEKDLSLASSGRKDFEYSLDLAQWYRDFFASEPHRLRDLIREIYGKAELSQKPNLDHYLLLALNTPYVITTNYDRLLERTLEALRRPYQLIPQDAQASQFGAYSTCVIKFHGDAFASEDIVLSRDDYEHFFQNHPALTLLLESLLLHQAFLFVGYSLRDTDFRQVYSRIERMLRDAKRPAYAVSFDASSGQEQALRQSQWERKKLFLIPFSGGIETQKAQLRRWLDRLAEHCSDRDVVFLAEGQGEGDTPPALAGLRASLYQVAKEIEALCNTMMAPESAHITAQVVSLLSTMGWRPSDQSALSRVWVRIATSFPVKSEERRIYLRRALEHTDHSTATEAILKMMEE
jgi:O-acetyl-ADP-ribose deacetylase (regulator of RNase III)